MSTIKGTRLSRREFLKLSSLGILGAVLPTTDLIKEQSPLLGRVIESAVVYDRPSFSGTVVRPYAQDCILPIQKAVTGDPQPAYNQVWYKIGEIGYVHSTLLQPVDIRTHTPPEEIPKKGVLAEVSVPFTDAFKSPSRHAPVAYRYYYGSTHWVDRISTDKSGRSWYRVADDREEGYYYFVNSSHLHVIPPEQLALISAHLNWDEKRIEVYVREQIMIAYERDNPVFVTQISTGDYETNSLWQTPEGRYWINYKRPSCHMTSPSPEFGDYDFPGVPWVCYFTGKGHAFHGTYWHNDFGRIRSHGCINLTPQDAIWLYRWTTPTVPPETHKLFNSKYGTMLDIYY